MVDISKTDISTDSAVSPSSSNPVSAKSSTQPSASPEAKQHPALSQLPKKTPATPRMSSTGKLPEDSRSPKEEPSEASEHEDLPAGVKAFVSILKKALPESTYQAFSDKAIGLCSVETITDPEKLQADLDKIREDLGHLQSKMVDGNLKTVRTKTRDHDERQKIQGGDEDRYLSVLDPWQEHFDTVSAHLNNVQLLIDCAVSCKTARGHFSANDPTGIDPKEIQSGIDGMNKQLERLTRRLGKFSEREMTGAKLAKLEIAYTMGSAHLALHNLAFHEMEKVDWGFSVEDLKIFLNLGFSTSTGLPNTKIRDALATHHQHDVERRRQIENIKGQLVPFVDHQLSSTDRATDALAEAVDDKKRRLNAELRRAGLGQAKNSLWVIEELLIAATPRDEQSQAILAGKTAGFKDLDTSLIALNDGLESFFARDPKDAKPLADAATLRRAHQICTDLCEASLQTVASFDLPTRHPFLSEIGKNCESIRSDLELAALTIQEEANHATLLAAADGDVREAAPAAGKQYEGLESAEPLLGWTEAEPAEAAAGTATPWATLAAQFDETFDATEEEKSTQSLIDDAKAGAEEIRIGLRDAPLKHLPSEQSITTRVNALTKALNTKADELRAIRGDVLSLLDGAPAPSSTEKGLEALRGRLIDAKKALDGNLASLKAEVERLNGDHRNLSTVRTAKRFLFKDMVMTREYVEPLTRAGWMSLQPPQGKPKKDGAAYVEKRQVKLHLSKKTLEDMGGERVLREANCLRNAKDGQDILGGRQGVSVPTSPTPPEVCDARGISAALRPRQA